MINSDVIKEPDLTGNQKQVLHEICKKREVMQELSFVSPLPLINALLVHILQILVHEFLSLPLSEFWGAIALKAI